MKRTLISALALLSLIGLSAQNPTFTPPEALDFPVQLRVNADKQTGTAAINMKYSQKRANDLKNMLVNKYGINGSRISATAKGDTAQPFAENAKNRVSIISGTTKK